VLLRDARVQAGERLAVRRQHQRVGRQRQVAVERAQVARQRIAVGLEVEHADVGRDARQHHVARDQQLVVSQYSDTCSGEWPWPTIARNTRFACGPTAIVAVLHAPVARRHRGTSFG
jgi:hypothetical protein